MLERFTGISKEEKEKLTFDDFTVTEIKFLIEETVLSDRDRKIAELILCREFTNERVAHKLGFDDKTIGKAAREAEEKIKKTILKVI